LIDFAAFLEANDTPHITTELAVTGFEEAPKIGGRAWCG
jgi:hypothetical protein